MKVAYIARNDGTDMRVSKECNSLQNAGHDVIFVGWRGDPDADLPDPMPTVRKRFNTSGSSANKVLRLIAFGRHVFEVLDEVEPDVVQCANEEYAFIVLQHRQRRNHTYRVVCDIFDSLGLRMGHAPFPIGSLALRITEYVHRRSDRIIVTDTRRRARLGPYRDKAVVIPNYPVDPGPDVSMTPVAPAGEKRLFVAGSLSTSRGLRSALAVLDRRPDVSVVSAGWVYDDAASRFVAHPQVDFRGVLTPDEALRLAATCNAIVALYQPSSENNLLASPNKVFDALCIGRPVIINQETAISEWIAEIRAGELVTYDNDEDLETAIDALPTKRDDVYAEANRLRAMFDSGYSWTIAEKVLLTMYTEMALGIRGEDLIHA